MTMTLPRLALYQPDIPQNTGTLLRLAACLGVGVDIIEPCGFPLSDAKLKRAGMDYLALASIARHADFAAFLSQKSGRVVLIETDGATPYADFLFQPGDILLLGSESAGTPRAIYGQCDASVFIPQQAGRSLNVAVAAAMVLGEALRQMGGFKR
jgi:tRNA (cytidine/uridine-2'-O-)-methyltransferase